MSSGHVHSSKIEPLIESSRDPVDDRPVVRRLFLEEQPLAIVEEDSRFASSLSALLRFPEVEIRRSDPSRESSEGKAKPLLEPSPGRGFEVRALDCESEPHRLPPSC